MTDRAKEVAKLWRILAIGSDSIIELRALQPKGLPGSRPPLTRHFRVDDHPSIEAFKKNIETAALRLNDDGYNVYVVMNPIRRDYAGHGSVSDKDILYRDLLLVDIDRAGHPTAPANQAELDAAKALADQVRDYLTSLGCDPPITVMSGNGYHLYFVLTDVDNTPETATLVASVLRNLAKLFNNEVVEIDTTVYNGSRITKVPGTIMRKGLATEDRPYRMAVVCDEK
jgi:hypothetical protein